jgi:hypothetical protein
MENEQKLHETVRKIPYSYLVDDTTQFCHSVGIFCGMFALCGTLRARLQWIATG